MKRFTDTCKWDKDWFMSLSPKLKCLWQYLCDKCDIAGVWSPNFKLASVHIGDEITTADMDMLGDNVKKLSDGKYLISSFVAFQYGELKPDCRPHQAVIRRLAELNIAKTAPPKQKKARAAIQAEIEDRYFQDDDVNTMFIEFLKARAEWKKPATKKAVELLIGTIKKHAGGQKEVALEMIAKSIKSRWTDIYPFKTNDNGKEKQFGKVNQSDIEQFIGG